MHSLNEITAKILDPKKLEEKLADWHSKGLKIAFTNGCFDILHRGHIDYLSKAKDTADILLIGVNTDDSVRKLKGSHRPINDELSRAMILSSLFFVDAVAFFCEDTPYELIKRVQPDVLIKGSDYKAEDIVGYDIVKAKGGQILTIDYLPGFSTSNIEKKIKES